MATPLIPPSPSAAQPSWVYQCEKCRSRVKLRWSQSSGVQVAWILLDRSIYQGKERVVVYPSVFQERPGELHCPVCGTTALRKLQSTVAPKESDVRPSWMQSIPPQMR